MLHPVTQQILSLFEKNGSSMYGGEAVTQLDHALQCAELARQHNATDELITASLAANIAMYELRFSAGLLSFTKSANS